MSTAEEDNEKLITGIREMRLRILVIDDKEAFRTAMKFTLEKTFAAEVWTLASGVAALEVLTHDRAFQRVFLDIRMSPLDGIATYNKLQKLGIPCPVTMMSAYVSSKDWDAAVELGLEVIPKPIKTEDLSRVLSQTPGQVDE